MIETLTLPALALTQSPGRQIYAFGVDGKDVPRFAEVFRASRDEGGSLFGYQRHQVRRHIEEIRKYVESERPMIPNAVVLAFSPAVRFEPMEGLGDGPATIGTLHIPLSADGEGGPTGWIVDGQQRLTAIGEADVEQFKMFAVGFIAADEGEQREQFILVNNTRPLPRSLIYELLPGVDAELPPALAKRRLPTLLVDILNNTPGSPLYHVVRQHTNPSGRLRDNSLIKMLENSLSDGVLYRYRLTEPERSQLEGMAKLLMEFWSAVKEVWGDIWELKPRQSRLLHGAGVVSLGFLMDGIAGKHRDSGWPNRELFVRELEVIKPHCRWTEGHWDFGPTTKLRWNEVQNTSKDVQLLANHLMRIYLRPPNGERNQISLRLGGSPPSCRRPGVRVVEPTSPSSSAPPTPHILMGEPVTSLHGLRPNAAPSGTPEVFRLIGGVVFLPKRDSLDQRWLDCWRSVDHRLTSTQRAMQPQKRHLTAN